ncbi:ATP-binding cassette domain-containing protein [Ekhidna sp.]
MNILEADSINIAFDGRTILSDIYVKCETNEIVGLVGRNGSGKSTLMKILFGSLRGENQSVRFNKTYYHIPFENKGLINYLPQDIFLPDKLTFREARELYDIKAEFEETKEIENIRLGQLSKGQARFLETLIILYAPTMFALLDEPFSYLSPVLIESLIPHIKKQSRVKGIILSDHSYRTVLDVCSRFYFLTDGYLQSIFEKEELQQFGYLPE